MSFVGKVGGVAFDGVAKPGKGLTVNSLALNYLRTNSDGNRLGVVMNRRTIAAPIYDWQLIPIANFVDGPFYSCVTLFGELDDPKIQTAVLKQGGRVINYHPAFADNLMGLRLFQLDNLLADPYSWDLITNAGTYLLGAGESAPNVIENKRGLLNFWIQNPRLIDRFDSYVISDHRREIVFAIEANALNIVGEPAYYFWRMDRTAIQDFAQTEARIRSELLSEFERFAKSTPGVSVNAWLRDLLIAEANQYDRLIGNYRIIQALKYPQLLNLLSTQDVAARKVVVDSQSLKSLISQLVLLRLLSRLQAADEVREFSEKVSNETSLLRAINPAVWDAGVTVLRYAAFFRYCKENCPQQWQLFMAQIKQAPRPEPFVTTQSIIDPPPPRTRSRRRIAR